MPRLKITVLTTLIFMLFQPATAQRTDLQYLWIYFTQESQYDVDEWVITWYGDGTDSLIASKNDTIRTSIKNIDGEWVVFSYLSDEADTIDVRVKIDKIFQYDITYTFDVIARDIYGNESDPSEPVSIRFFVSDMNKIIDPDMDTGYKIGDGRVDWLDLIELSKNWGRSGLTYYDHVDITGDTFVDWRDLVQLAKDFGKIYIP